MSDLPADTLLRLGIAGALVLCAAFLFARRRASLKVATPAKAAPAIVGEEPLKKPEGAPRDAVASPVPTYADSEGEDDDLITRVTVSPVSTPNIPVSGSEDEDDGGDSERKRAPSTLPIVYDDDAEVDEPTGPVAIILISAAGQSDPGLKRQQNEDSFLVLPEHSLFVVADGMGGYAGGEVASRLAVETIDEAFKTGVFAGTLEETVPTRGAELALAIKMANQKILAQASTDPLLAEMGTTIVAARFSPKKQRLYIGHVGDSRCYRLRANELRQVTTDHTMGQIFGTTGRAAAHLSRAVGIGKTVLVDLIIGKPRPEDVYLFCSDGLSKMVSDEQIHAILASERDLQSGVDKLIAMANAGGGKDNVTVILVRVEQTPNYALSNLDA